jgi:glutathionylspermidine synthase
VDNKLVPIRKIDEAWLKNAGLRWFAAGENSDYLADQLVRVDQNELLGFRNAANNSYQLLLNACDAVSRQNLWSQLHIPPKAVKLMQYSLQNEKHLHLAGRFDFAGGFDGVPIKLLEFNADSYSLLCETVKLQPKLALDAGFRVEQQWSNAAFADLITHFRSILQRHSDFEPNLLVSDLGNTEDRLNLSIIEEAAKAAGFQKVTYMPLERVVFSEGEGIFVELSPEEFIRYDFFYKMIPWDFILFEEPELFDILEELILAKECIVINPAFTMLMQSKGILPILSQLYPSDSLVLRASLSKSDLMYVPHVSKPMYGRMGDNVQLYKANATDSYYENDGDYGHFPMVYQEMAQLNEDSEMYMYQPSVYYFGQPSGFCLRRQDDLVIDDDAEFVGHVVG